MEDVPSQDELDAEILYMRKRNRTYRAFFNGNTNLVSQSSYRLVVDHQTGV